MQNDSVIKANYVTAFVAGMLLMLMVSILLVDNSAATDRLRELRKLKETCEETLPRNEHCVIVAVPTSKD